MILRYEETLVQDSKCPSSSAGSVHKAPGRIWWAIRFSNCLPASESEHLLRSQGLGLHETSSSSPSAWKTVPPALTEPAPAPVTCALAGGWLLIPAYGTQSLPSPFSQLHLAAHSVPFGPPSLFQTKLTQPVPTCRHRPSSPFPAANDSPCAGYIAANCRYVLSLKICPHCQSKPLTCPSGPARGQITSAWGTAATLLA